MTVFWVDVAFCDFTLVHDVDLRLLGDILEQVADLTCHCNQGAEQLDQRQHKGNAKITRKREEEGITVCLHGMLGGQGKDTRCWKAFTNCLHPN